MTINRHSLGSTPRFRFSIAVGVSIAVTALLTGCSDPSAGYLYNETDHDYRKRHAVTVESTVARNWITFAKAQGHLSAADNDKLQRYFSDFIVAGHGHITARLATRGLTLAVRNNRLAALREVARNQGIKAEELEVFLTPVIKTPKGSADIELGYIRYIAGLPNCPDWSKNVDNNRANSDHSNFGCATQSNLGAMLVDPADLIKPRKSRAADGATVDTRIRTVGVPRGHPKKGVGTVGAGSPVVPAASGTGSAPAPEGTTTGQSSTETTE
ncbi:MAG: CpaD family pilus assembly lipoprotein [Alphaproteobacteria bacterium]|jgi:pilus assembly protein CpaD|nr:CpaD family pilus assembly lipoprotein [Alphaproteobacteria bacterium]MBT4018894.1 CpaD family pilus assembly lipoprotein [Alphaproteobacteria bacterium]MBT4966448.1 CpaD family pilus assembly lipoprotein [Alphaproteobacteria bacterium]MBT5160624.1 CpaD family pilus assembly lipoprotein [Alphaproteobacteria bacterium]MBT7747901.1 CpaD family pilus assembly lipoprotein [Alphaproteobacteria bacterium]